MHTKNRRYLFIALTQTLLFCLCACDDASQVNSTIAQSDQSLKLSSKAQVELKPGAAVSLLGPKELKGDVNQLVSDTIRVQLTRDKVWDLAVSCDPDVQILSETHLQIPVLTESDLQKQELFELPIKLLAKQAGRYYLRLHFSHQSDDSTEVRELAIAVNLGNVSLAADANQKTQMNATDSKIAVSNDGQKIIEMPADEKIQSKK